MYAGLGVIMVKKLFLAQKWVVRAMIGEALKNDSWSVNHIFTRITPKPTYIYLNTFLRENFSKKNLVPWDPLGVPGVPILGSPW